MSYRRIGNFRREYTTDQPGAQHSAWREEHRVITLQKLVKRLATEVGFDVVGISPATEPLTSAAYRRWLAEGHHGEMAYLERPDTVYKRGALDRIMPAVRSIISVGLNYHSGSLPPTLTDDPSRGIIASYARGTDYHELVLPRLREMGRRFREQSGHMVEVRAYVDTGPILEREYAARAGLGFIGKNTHLISPRLGSWLLLGELLLDIDLPPSHLSDHGQQRERGSGRETPWAREDAALDPTPLLRKGTCGACTRCLDVCPTGALVSPYTLDARRCIAYLTIEHRGPIPRAMRPLIGNRIFGCDICQDVCPWNRRFSQPTSEPTFRAAAAFCAPHLTGILELDPDAFAQRYRGSPILRAKRRGLLRNAAVAVGNGRDRSAIRVLSSSLRDAEALIRGHAAWALGRIGSEDARSALQDARNSETDDWVTEELDAALRTRTEHS